jgi:hypothetical protein
MNLTDCSENARSENLDLLLQYSATGCRVKIYVIVFYETALAPPRAPRQHPDTLTGTNGLEPVDQGVYTYSSDCTQRALVYAESYFADSGTLVILPVTGHHCPTVAVPMVGGWILDW